MKTKLAEQIDYLTSCIEDGDDRLWIKSTREDAIAWRKRLQSIERSRSKAIPLPTREELIQRIGQSWDGATDVISFDDGDFSVGLYRKGQLYPSGHKVFEFFHEQQRGQGFVDFCESLWQDAAAECEGGWMTIVHCPSRRIRTFDAKQIATAIRWMSMADSLHQASRRKIFQEQTISGQHGRVGLLF